MTSMKFRIETSASTIRTSRTSTSSSAKRSCAGTVARVFAPKTEKGSPSEVGCN
jgi:hypothetical protein